MEKLVKKYEKEYMKTAMLKHEETFREQVSELHRLYRVQKLLMGEINSTKSTKLVNPSQNQQPGCSYKARNRGRSLNLELPADEYIEENYESDVDLTLAIGPSARRKEGASFPSDLAMSFSSSSSSESENVKDYKWGLTMSYCQGEKDVFGVKELMSQGRLDQPSWHVQCLSLNMA